MKFTITLAASPLATDDLAQLLALGHDADIVKAAQKATSEIRALFTSVDTGDLLRHAMAAPDPLGWLRDLAGSSAQMKEALEAERHASKLAFAADAVRRHRFDSAACRLMNQATEVAERELRIAMNAKRGLEELRNELTKSGLSAAEAQRVIDARVQAGELHPHEYSRAMAAAAEAEDRRDALGKYLRDPLREFSDLPSPLQAELLALT